jgi:hypothetical protein
MANRPPALLGSRVLILRESYKGEEGVCLGPAEGGRWFVSPDSTDEILCMEFERDFGLLVKRDQHQMTH